MSNFERLDIQVQELIDSACDAYESHLTRGLTTYVPASTLEEYLASVEDPDARRILFSELVGVDLEHLRNDKRAGRIDELRRRFPQFSEVVDEVSNSSTSIKHSEADETIAAGSGTTPQPSNADGAEPKTEFLGQYELLEKVGSGAFGHVWRANDSKLDRTVAIKLPRTEKLSEADAQRFLKEAQLAAKLKHPNIVGVHEIGTFEETPFIVSDFVDGLSISEWQELETRSGADITRLCIRIGDALHHAHEAGIVHRDLKPTNILVDADNEPHVRRLRFGQESESTRR